MEFDEIVVKESPGLCRCCLSEGCYKDMGTEYTWMNENEVYADMLLECFDISISQHNEGPNGPNRLICEVCITRLRDACNFKKQVLDSEKKFVDMVGRGEFRPKVLIYQSQMKSEVTDMPEDETEVEYLEDIDFGDDDEPLKIEASSSEIAVEALPVAKRGRPRKGPKAEKKKPKLNERPKTKTSKALVKGHARAKKDLPVIRVRSMSILQSLLSATSDTNRKKFPRLGVVALIHSAHVCPFKFYRFFICVYCPGRFISMPDLVEHFKDEHRYVTEAETRKAIVKISSGEPVKINMLNYDCKLCDDTILNLEHLKHHLTEKHKLPIDFDKDMIWPFKITEREFGCPMCGIKLEQYSQLSKHINEHFDNFICSQCGAKFATEVRLRRHGSSHEDGAYPCHKCDKFYKNTESRLNHYQRVHLKIKKNRCMYCEEAFTDYIQKQRHMAVVHGIQQRKYRCSFCPKVFQKSSVLRGHERTVHLQMDPYVCDFCGYTCYDKKHLVEHMIRHTGVRKYMCQVCGKKYARPYTLTEHMRIHNNDRRFSCQYCEKAFVQKCSLKGHMKTQHKEFLMYE